MKFTLACLSLSLMIATSAFADDVANINICERGPIGDVIANLAGASS